MSKPNTLDVCRLDLFTAEDELRLSYTDSVVATILRIREEYNWFLSNPDAKDRQFVENAVSRFGITKMQSYKDLAVVKALLPHLGHAVLPLHGLCSFLHRARGV